MAFPTNPTNGQAATVDNISYIYNSTLGVWESNQITSSANLTVSGNATIGGNVTATEFVGSGAYLTNLPQTYTDSNVAAYMPTYLPTYTGNVAAQNYTASLFYKSTRTISANTTIGASDNSMSVGPITIADGVTVTVASGGEWSIT